MRYWSRRSSRNWYKASRAGVKIDLIVRGVRACARCAAGCPRQHHGAFDASAASWSTIGSTTSVPMARRYCTCRAPTAMDRNLFRRVEVAFPVLDRKAEARKGDQGKLADSPARQRRPHGSCNRMASTCVRRSAVQGDSMVSQAGTAGDVRTQGIAPSPAGRGGDLPRPCITPRGPTAPQVHATVAGHPRAGPARASRCDPSGEHRGRCCRARPRWSRARSAW